MTSYANPTADAVDSAVRALFDAASTAWAAGDADAFAACYSETATVILPGVYLPGRQAIQAGMGAAFAGPLKSSRRIHEVADVRVLEDAAVVISRSVTVAAGQSEPAAERWEWGTWVLVQQDGKWLIEAYHGSPQQATEQR
ncbi:SgcJ/EcaC family oxidoreductase [Nocardia sp. NEAU-G5]|uniref:SgcJ/EcaC family oxidoreductase n=1 Tax=Nocardia albiluteola TaxID=2842303 RepID=A0ABS6B1A7_9NOCA|nr:SgcJ/EcaC family oxidoreductase [Nocardia albiluteola]MBU3063570.1 SgcJ/EcaC family oxidoreductase [Nocardia albiluteola]